MDLHWAANTESLVHRADLVVKRWIFFAAEMVRVLLEAFPQLSVTFDQSNSTALHTAAAQGHIEVVNFLLETNSSLATIPKNNGKTALHSSARNGHVAVVKALLSKEEGILNWRDKKGQTALHMAVKGQRVDVVNELIQSDPALGAIIDGKGNTALHIATRKGRIEVISHMYVLHCKYFIWMDPYVLPTMFLLFSVMSTRSFMLKWKHRTIFQQLNIDVKSCTIIFLEKEEIHVALVTQSSLSHPRK